jgi:hypothetical protein
MDRPAHVVDHLAPVTLVATITLVFVLTVVLDGAVFEGLVRSGVSQAAYRRNGASLNRVVAA